MDNPPLPHPLKVVIVEDNLPLADIYKTRLELIGYECHVAYDGAAGLDVIERERPNLVLLDLMVPKIAGDQVLERMRASQWGKDIKVYIISNLNEEDAPVGLRKLGIEGYAVKANLASDQLDQLVDSILKPAGQKESTSLETQTIIPHDESPSDSRPVAIPVVQTPPPASPPPPPPEPAAPAAAPATEPEPPHKMTEMDQQSL